NPRGGFSFTGFLTSQLDANGSAVPGTGNPFADFLLGLPFNTGEQFGNPNLYLRSWGFAAYAQDDWRLTQSFSIQYGLRYERVTPPIELFNNLVNLDVANLAAVSVVTPSSGIYSRALIHGTGGNWEPRFGFAWQPKFIKPKTVMRGGYSIFYNESIYN